MPELPEVETTRRGISPHIQGSEISRMTVRQRQLRWPVTDGVEKAVRGQTVRAVSRRGKYLLLDCGCGVILIHLGMSGSLRIVPSAEVAGKHDHVDLLFAGGKVLRFHDPRKFGCVLWLQQDPMTHPLLQHLGPEPLSDDFSPEYLFQRTRKRKIAIKTLIMDSQVVVGVGNIYANEALFNAGIRPTRRAGTVTRAACGVLVREIRAVLSRAIRVGGTTLRDFVGGDGRPGYFRQSLQVYGRAGEPCKRCLAPLREKRLGQRSTVYCAQCQK